MRNIILSLTLSALSISCFSQTPDRSETLFVNGKNIFYESFGEGEPLFFFHGYSLSSQAWKPFVSAFSKKYKVYIVDLTGHGKSDRFKEDLSIKSVGEDMEALIRKLGHTRINAIGFSFGGDMLYQLALLRPKLIKSMITIGAVGTWTIKDFSEFSTNFTIENKENFPWLETYHKDDDKIQSIMHQLENYTVRLTDEELKTIKTDVLLMIGDDDEGMNLDEIVRVRKNLPNSDLWILPNVAHSAHEGEMMDDFIKHALAFLSKER